MKLGRNGELLPVRGFSHFLAALSGRSACSSWRSIDGVLVISAREDAVLPGTDDAIGPQWHLSVSHGGQRPADDVLRRVIASFFLPAFEEDNHHPGVARHLWCPLDEQFRIECECKLTETVVVEPDGYQWTNPTDGPCRGCEYERSTGRPCSIHASIGPSA